MEREAHYRMTTKGGAVYLLDENGAVLERSDGSRGWNYSGKWIICGFKTRHNARRTISLEEAVNGADTGQGWVVDLDHGTYRLWGSPSDRRLRSIEVVREEVSA